jgi:hypothetical protein
MLMFSKLVELFVRGNTLGSKTRHIKETEIPNIVAV